MKDLTKGKPSRLILAFALPIFLANLLQLTYSLVDTRIVGSFLGEDALAAVGATSSLSNLIIGFLMACAVSPIVTESKITVARLIAIPTATAMPNHTPMEYAILSFTNHTPISSTITPYNKIETTSPGNASLILFNMVFFLFLLPV